MISDDLIHLAPPPRPARLVCWWSAGVASATATALALRFIDADEKIVAYCDTSSSEHPDNERFLKDCERLYGQSIVRLRSPDYEDTWDVYEKTRYLVGVQGARCTTELKKLVRRAFEREGDVQVFGYTASEGSRADLFVANNPEVNARFPLLELGFKHADCIALLKARAIAIPEMYALGYRNNNCIGCVKGGMGYWNKIRRDFPATFERMARLERRLDVSILRDANGRVFLDELDPSRGRYEAEPEVECGVACGVTLEALAPAAAAPHRAFVYSAQQESPVPDNKWQSDTQFVDFLKRMDYLGNVSTGVILYMHEAWRASRVPNGNIEKAATQAAWAVCDFAVTSKGDVSAVGTDVMQRTIDAIENYALAVKEGA